MSEDGILRAIDTIKKGQEITWDYGEAYWSSRPWIKAYINLDKINIRCGSIVCIYFIYLIEISSRQ